MEWEDFGIRIGNLGFGLGGLGNHVNYSRTEKSHLVQIKIEPDVKKDQIKVRLVKPGLLEIEWPRTRGEEIPVD